MNGSGKQSFYEIQLSNSSLIVAFLVAVGLGVAVFMLGVMVGRDQGPQPLLEGGLVEALGDETGPAPAVDPADTDFLGRMEEPAEETTANLCLGNSAAVREQVGDFFARLSTRREEVKRRCRTVLQAKADELIGGTQANSLRSANVVFTLASV